MKSDAEIDLKDVIINGRQTAESEDTEKAGKINSSKNFYIRSQEGNYQLFFIDHYDNAFDKSFFVIGTGKNVWRLIWRVCWLSHEHTRWKWDGWVEWEWWWNKIWS